MKRKFVCGIVAVAALAVCYGVAACSDDPTKSTTKYTVAYSASGGTGELPKTTSVKKGATVKLAQSGLEKTGYTFYGWSYGGNVYGVGADYTVNGNVTFAAEWTANTYTVVFDACGGNGEMPDMSFTYDAEQALAENMFMRGSADFVGWADSASGQVKYTDGQTVKNLTAENNGTVTLYAVWEEPASIGFSQAEYFYDKAGGEDLELPVTLLGAVIRAVEIDGETLDTEFWNYDADKKTVVINEETVIMLSLGDHTVKLITDSLGDDVPLCKLTTENSVPSSFDVSDRVFDYGAETELKCAVSGDVTVGKLKNGDITVPEKMWSFNDGMLAIDGKWISKFTGKTAFTLFLSNNDTYVFEVYNNTVFSTDYDVTTTHFDVNSNTGQNPMYQYYDNVKIIDAPTDSGMEGKVLEITPNTAEVLYDCNGYITLGADNFDSTWRKGGFKVGKYYAVSFDYYTVGTSVGEFAYRTVGNGKDEYVKPLLYGVENDGTLHRFADVFPYSAVDGTGVYIWAKFIGGGGKIYVDNFVVVELDGIVSVTARDYTYQSDSEYEITVENSGLDYELYLGAQKLEFTEDADGAVTFTADTMKKFEIGNNTVRVVTAFYETTFTVRVIDSRLAELTETKADFGYYGSGNLKLAGNFEQGYVISFKQKRKHYDGGYPGEWEFWHSDTDTEYKQYAAITPGVGGEGYLEIDREFLKKFYGVTEFEVQFSNGVTQTVTITSDVAFTSNFDETYIAGYLNGGENFGYIENSGAHGSVTELKERATGNKALYYTDTLNSEECNLFTLKFHEHPWTWLTVDVDGTKLIRITFDYIVSDVSDVYFLIMKLNSEDYEKNFFGNGSVTPMGGWEEVRYPLVCDGMLHSFDSGWFTYNGELRMSKIAVPKFAAAEDRYVMIDDYTVTQIAKTTPVVYEKGKVSECVVSFDGPAITEIVYNDVNYAIVSEDKTILDTSKLDALSFGKYVFTVKTAAGNIPLDITIKGAGTVDITKRDYGFIYDSGDLTIEGTFDKVTVTSAAKKGGFKINASDEFDLSDTTLDPSHFVIQDGKMTIKKELLNTFYLTTAVTVGFSNGEQASITIDSNVRFFTDLDGTYVMQPLNSHKNSYTTQDSSQLSVVDDGTGNHAVRYCTYEATEGHAKNDVHNMVFVFETAWYNEAAYAKFIDGDSSKPILAADKDYIISFDYKIVNAEGRSVTYSFCKIGADKESIAGESGTFTTTLIGGAAGISRIGISSDVVGGAEGCYMLIDNYRIVETDKE